MPDEVRKMDNRRCLIFIKGYDAVMDDKYHTWESKAYLESEQLGPYMSKAEKESLLREGQKRFYLDGGGVTLVKSYVRQIEKYHCVYEESKVFQELEKVRAGNAYLLSHVCYNQTGKLEHLMSVALSVEAKTVKAADGILHAHTIVGAFSKADMQKNWTEENAVFHEMSPKEAAAFFCPENRSLVFGFKKKAKKSRRKKKMENLKLINETDLKYFRELEKQGKAVILEIDPEVLLNTEIRPKEKPSWDGLEKWLTEIGKSLP